MKLLGLAPVPLALLSAALVSKAPRHVESHWRRGLALRSLRRGAGCCLFDETPNSYGPVGH